MASEDTPYTIESPTKIRLGPEAKYWAKEFGMTLEEYGQYLLQQQRRRETGNTQ